MSPSSSAQDSHSARPSHSRQSSIANPTTTTKPKTPPPAPPAPVNPVHYTVILRLPFPRGTFTDPEPVSWDATKDRALWKIISKASNSRDIDWEDIASRFEVGLGFLMQQAAWLYERHFEGVRVQMRRLAEGGGDGRDSKGALRKESPGLLQMSGAVGEGSGPSSPRSLAPGIERTPSSATLTQSRIGSAAMPGLRQRALRGSNSSQQRRPVAAKRAAEPEDEDATAGSTSESEEESGPSMARSQAFRRAPVASNRPATSNRRTLATLSSEGDASADDDDDDDDPESSGGYLPFAAAAPPARETTSADPAATIRGSPRRDNATLAQPLRSKQPEHPHNDSSASSSSSAAQVPSTNPSRMNTHPDPSQRPGPISPRHRAHLAHLSPRQQRQAARAEGSEGTPSMGSSFSDLDDASVTQSALEEALMSDLRAGGASQAGSLASRVSGLGRAWTGGR